MRWNDPPPNKVGDRRSKTKFLFFPLNICGENRWLEWTTWEEKLTLRYHLGPLGNATGTYKWEPVRWLIPKPSLDCFNNE